MKVFFSIWLVKGYNLLINFTTIRKIDVTKRHLFHWNPMRLYWHWPNFRLKFDEEIIVDKFSMEMWKEREEIQKADGKKSHWKLFERISYLYKTCTQRKIIICWVLHTYLCYSIIMTSTMTNYRRTKKCALQ